MLEPTLEARDAPMTSPTAKVLDNQSTSSLVSIGGTLLACAVVIFLVLSGLGLLGAAIVAPFLIFGFTLVALCTMVLALPVLVISYYLLLILALPFVRSKLPGAD